MKLPTFPRGLAGKIVKYRPLSELIRLPDLEDSACFQAWKKINKAITLQAKIWQMDNWQIYFTSNSVWNCWNFVHSILHNAFKPTFL